MIKKKKLEKQELKITGTVVRVKTEDVKSKTGEFYYNEDKTQTKKKITVDLYVGYEVISNKEVDKYYRIGLSYYPGSYKGIMDMVDQMYDLKEGDEVEFSYTIDTFTWGTGENIGIGTSLRPCTITFTGGDDVRKCVNIIKRYDPHPDVDSQDNPNDLPF